MKESLKKELVESWRPFVFWFSIVVLALSLTVNIELINIRDNLVAKNDSLEYVISAKDTTHMLVEGHNEKLARALDVFTGGVPVVFTGYNAIENQTDDSPFITASNDSVSEGNIALSRDFLKVYGLGGNVEWGDTVWVVLPVKVTDSMHGRWSNKADIFFNNFVDAMSFGRKEGYIYTKGS